MKADPAPIFLNELNVNFQSFVLKDKLESKFVEEGWCDFGRQRRNFY